uniref:C2H2-type domain-containing protein n=1 Tax=viral metagenome TaxID=1070528 RepID=A0A6C0CS20_9ZZZZ
MLTCSLKKYTCSLCKYATDKRYNFDRHTSTVHKDTVDVSEDNTDNVYVDTQMNNIYTQINNIYTQMNNIDTQSNNIDTQIQYNDTQIQNIDTQMNNINIEVDQKEFKCESCYKSFSRKYNLDRHIPNCNRRQTPYQCTSCLKSFTCSSGLSQHKHFCKGYPLIDLNKSSNTVLPFGSTQVNGENVQMIQQQQNAETINNTTNNITNNTVNITILKCPESREEKFDFDCTNISYEDLMALLQKSKDAFIRFNNFVGKVLENPKNRVVRKTSPKDSHCLVHRGDDIWELAHDDDTFPIITHHMTTAVLGKTNGLTKNQKNYYTDSFQGQVQDINEMDYDSSKYNSIEQRMKLQVINRTRIASPEKKKKQS